MYRGLAVIGLAVLATGLAGCDPLTQLFGPTPYTLQATPKEITDTIPGQRCALLVTVTDADVPSAWPTRITADAPGATVTVENALIRPGDVAEVTVIPLPLAQATAQSTDGEGRDITATIHAERAGVARTTTVPIHVTSEEEDLVGPLAAEVRDQFIPWLAEHRAELGIAADTQWTGTIVKPHYLVVTHYLYFSDEWEMHVYWHVMIPPYDWAKIELRRRFEETLPSLAFEIPSRSADPIEVQEIEPEGVLWR